MATEHEGNQPTLVGWFLRDVAVTTVAALLCWLCFIWYDKTGSSQAGPPGGVLGFLSAYIVCYMVHEWGHQIGGVSAGATMPLNEYSGMLLGQFDISAHSTRQFLWLSWGGVIGYLSVAAITLLMYFKLDLDWVGAGLAIGGLAFVFQSLSVDLPQIFKVLRGADPLETNKHGASGEMILTRTWQSWLVLTVVLIVWNIAVYIA